MRRVLGVCLIAGIAVAQPAFADVPNKARSLADRGRAAHDQHDYAGAIAAFTEAYAIAPAPALLFNLAQAYRLAGRCDDASLMYRRFLASNPPDDARALAEIHLTAVERCAHKLDVVTDPKPAKIRLPTAPPKPVALSDDRSAHGTHAKIGLSLAIGGAVALGVAGYYALDAHGTSQDVQRRYENGEKWKELAALDAQGERAATIARIAGVTGLVAAAVGATVLVKERRAQKRERGKRTVLVAPLARGANVSMAWQF
jgi:tetratricopeptide (TPR) repeat protein